jgi:hypothetical protein
VASVALPLPVIAEVNILFKGQNSAFDKTFRGGEGGGLLSVQPSGLPGLIPAGAVPDGKNLFSPLLISKDHCRSEVSYCGYLSPFSSFTPGVA